MHVTLVKTRLVAGLARASKEDALVLYATHWQADVDKLCSRLAALLGVSDAGALQRAVAAAWPFENQVRHHMILGGTAMHWWGTTAWGAVSNRCCRASMWEPGKHCKPSWSAQAFIAVGSSVGALHQTREDNKAYNQ